MKVSAAFLPIFINGMKEPISPNWRTERKQVSEKQARKNQENMERFKKSYKTLKNEKESTTILEFWNFEKPFLNKIPEKCGGCWLTNDRNFEYEADGIMFDNTRYKNAIRAKDLPDFNNRNLDSQYWVFWPREAASKGIEKGTNFNLVKQIHDWDGSFNLTASYRIDSDVVRPFGSRDSVLARHYSDGDHEPYEDIIKKIMARKESNGGKHTTWIVSNCGRTNGASARWNYATELIDEGLKINGFGDCFNNHLEGAPWSDKFGDGVIAGYKFYLAFENSVHCNGYISEKFWRNSLGTGAVPVVYGPHKSDVEAVAPANSYIFAEDFDTPKDLVDYLDYLDKNDTAYEEYHKWRADELDEEYEDLGPHTAEMMCNLCRNIKERKEADYPKRIIKSVMSWWWVNVHDDKCTGGYKLPEWITSFPPQTMENTYDELKLSLHENDVLK